MGFFSSKPKESLRPSKSQLAPYSFTSPPNVYSSSPPESRHRLAAAPQNSFYNDAAFSHSHVNYYPPANNLPPSGPAPCQIYTAPQPEPYRNQNGFHLEHAGSMVNLAHQSTNTATNTPAGTAYDDICTHLDDVMTLIDQESLSGHEKKLFLCQEPVYQEFSPAPYQTQSLTRTTPPDTETDRALCYGKKHSHDTNTRGQYSQPVVSSSVSANYFSKVELYANSKLPLNLPPLRL
jgi:hypothetical protein